MEGMLDCVYSTTNLGGYIEDRFCIRNAYYPKLRYTPFQSLRWLFNYLKKDNSDIIHFHGNPVWESVTLLLLVLIKKRIVYSIHNQIVFSDLKRYPKPLFWIFKIASRSNLIQWIAVNVTIKSQLEETTGKRNNISMIPAYIPSDLNENPLNPEIELFIRSRSKVISIYAHSTSKLDGKDLYGIDLALRAINKVKHIIHQIGLIIIIPGRAGENELIEYNSIINELNLNQNVLILFKPLLNPNLLWRRSDLVLRPTLSDGDSLLVRESLSEGTPVIASDVVERPFGTIIFKSEDVDDLADKILNTLVITKNSKIFNMHNNYELIKQIY